MSAKLRVKVASYKDNVPYDEYVHALDPLSHDPNSDDDTGTPMTDPYGELYWAVGTEDDFYCFDYAFLPDGKVILHAVVNSETGSFIEDAEYMVVDQKEAVAAAEYMVESALHWVADSEVQHDAQGWNQDPYYFVRCVERAVRGTRIADLPPAERFVEEEK